MTEAKASAVEVRVPVNQGDLMLPAPDDYQHHKKSILGALEKKETANSFYRNCLKRAQQAGVDTDALLEAHRIVRANDPRATANKLNQLAFALEQEGFSIHITVHDTLAGDEMDLIYRRFYQDGKAGKSLDCRYPVGSDLATQAARAWRHGMALNAGTSIEDSNTVVDEDTAAQEAKLPPPPKMVTTEGQALHS
jgi:hypothetical protein